MKRRPPPVLGWTADPRGCRRDKGAGGAGESLPLEHARQRSAHKASNVYNMEESYRGNCFVQPGEITAKFFVPPRRPLFFSLSLYLLSPRPPPAHRQSRTPLYNEARFLLLAGNLYYVPIFNDAALRAEFLILLGRLRASTASSARRDDKGGRGRGRGDETGARRARCGSDNLEQCALIKWKWFIAV